MKTFQPLPDLHTRSPQCICPKCRKRWRECECEMTDALRARIPNPPHEGRPWGFKDTHVKPPGWETKKQRAVLTPDHWKHISIVKRADGFHLLSFATQTALLKSDLRILQVPAKIKTYGLPHDEAIALGERIEKAFARLLKPPEKKRKEKERKFPLDASQREWYDRQLLED